MFSRRIFLLSERRDLSYNAVGRRDLWGWLNGFGPKSRYHLWIRISLGHYSLERERERGYWRRDGKRFEKRCLFSIDVRLFIMVSILQSYMFLDSTMNS